MPTSVSNQLNEIVELIVLTNPKALLDIGVGFGKYGLLAREYLEYWDGRGKYHDWQRRIDGIEAFPAYLTPVHEFVYSNMYKGDALQILPTLTMKYDLVLLIDILEHFAQDDGQKLLKECLRISRNVLVSTPKDMAVQAGAFNNPYEAHKFQWTRKHLQVYPGAFFVRNGLSNIAYFGQDAGAIHKKFIRRQVGSRYPWLRHVTRLINGKRP
ncbi:MAG: class I SAM-dependent methyltransferase [Patescibacteria group bacterium]